MSSINCGRRMIDSRCDYQSCLKAFQFCRLQDRSNGSSARIHANSYTPSAMDMMGSSSPHTIIIRLDSARKSCTTSRRIRNQIIASLSPHSANHQLVGSKLDRDGCLGVFAVTEERHVVTRHGLGCLSIAIWDDINKISRCGEDEC